MSNINHTLNRETAEIDKIREDLLADPSAEVAITIEAGVSPVTLLSISQVLVAVDKSASGSVAKPVILGDSAALDKVAAAAGLPVRAADFPRDVQEQPL